MHFCLRNVEINNLLHFSENKIKTALFNKTKNASSANIKINLWSVY